jgi:hypothetical protein
MSEENRDKNGEQEKSEKLLSRAFRFPKYGMLERQVCQRLLQATFSTIDSVFIKNITIAVLMMEPQTKKQKIDLDFSLFHKIAKISSSFQKVSWFKDQHGRTVYSVPWGFKTSEDFKNFIEPWYEGNIRFWGDYIKTNVTEGARIRHEPSGMDCSSCHYPLFLFDSFHHNIVGKNATDSEIKNYIWKLLPNNCPKCGDRIAERDLDSEIVMVVDHNAPQWSLFFEASGCLTHTGLNSLKNSFETWAMEFCTDANNVLSNLVSPATYDEVFKLFSKEKREEKE